MVFSAPFEPPGPNMPSRGSDDFDAHGGADHDSGRGTNAPAPVLPGTDLYAIERITKFEEPNPSSVLGPRDLRVGGKDVLWIRAYLPRAVRAWVTFKGKKTQMDLVTDHFYEARLPGVFDSRSRYTISFVDDSG